MGRESSCRPIREGLERIYVVVVTVSASQTAPGWRPGFWDVVFGLVLIALGGRLLSEAVAGEGFQPPTHSRTG